MYNLSLFHYLPVYSLSGSQNTILEALDDFKHRVLTLLQSNHNQMDQLRSDLAAETKRAARLEKEHERTYAKLAAQRDQVTELTREANLRKIQLKKLDDAKRQLELTTTELNSQRSRFARLMQEESARERATEELEKNVRLRDETINKQALDLTKYKGWLDQWKKTVSKGRKRFKVLILIIIYLQAKKHESEIKALRLENTELKEAQTRTVINETSKVLISQLVRLAQINVNMAFRHQPLRIVTTKIFP
jgi:hypothetical protein